MSEESPPQDLHSFPYHEFGPGWLAEMTCPKCWSHLAIHLPDPQLPERLLGTCSDCKSWFLLNVQAARMVLLSQEAGGEGQEDVR